MTTENLTVTERTGRLILTRGRTELQLDKTHGGIVEIRDAVSGASLCSVADCPDKARLFRLLAMRRGQRGRAADAHTQRGVVWERAPTGVTVCYPGLSFEGEPAPCSVSMVIQAGAEDELLLTLNVENEATDPIHEIQFPMLAGWRSEEGKYPVELTGGAKWRLHVGLTPAFGPPAYCQWYQQHSVDYPGTRMYMPWVDFAVDAVSGLALVNYMPRPYTGGVGGINLAGHEKGNLECYWWRHYPLVKQGRRWSSPPMGIRVRAGDWHDTADRYYDWFRERVGVPLRQPDSLRRCIGFQNIVLRNFDGTRHNDVETLAEHARAGRECGVDHLAVWDALSLGNYAIHEPDVDLFDYTDGEREALRQSIRRAREAGVTVSALSDFRHINVRSDLYPRYRTEAVLAMDGSEQRENWMGGARSSKIFTPHLGGNSIVLSPRSPETRKRFDELLDRYMALGYNAIFHDQPFLYQLDYNCMGEDDRPDDASTACYDNAAHVRERLRERHPDAYLIGEQFDIFSASRAIDLHMEWNFTNGGVDDLARTLFCCPHALLSYVIDYTTSGETHASRAFAAGLLLCITIDGGEAGLGKRPALAEHIGKLAALRKRCADRVAHGRFRHTVGIASELAEGMVAYAFDSADGPAVTIAAGEDGGTASVTVDRSRFQASSRHRAGTLHRLRGESITTAVSDTLEVELPPNQVVVWCL
jgi:hypothetical protein